MVHGLVHAWSTGWSTLSCQRVEHVLVHEYRPADMSSRRRIRSGCAKLPEVQRRLPPGAVVATVGTATTPPTIPQHEAGHAAKAGSATASGEQRSPDDDGADPMALPALVPAVRLTPVRRRSAGASSVQLQDPESAWDAAVDPR